MFKKTLLVLAATACAAFVATGANAEDMNKDHMMHHHMEHKAM